MLPRAVSLRVVCFGRQNTTLFHLPLGSFRSLSPAQGEVGTSRSGYIPSPPRTAGAGDGDLGVSPGAKEAAGTVTPSACAWTSAVPRTHFGNAAEPAPGAGRSWAVCRGPPAAWAAPAQRGPGIKFYLFYPRDTPGLLPAPHLSGIGFYSARSVNFS